MKNLKLFVFALCAVLLSVVTVNAACYVKGDTAVSGETQCQARIGNTTYDYVYKAWQDVVANGGTLELLDTDTTYTLGIQTTTTVTKPVTVIANGHKITIGSTPVTVKDKASLTFENAVVTIASGDAFSVEKGGSLTLNNVSLTTNSHVLKNFGTVVVNGGTYTSNHSGNDTMFINDGTLTLDNATLKGANVKTVLINRGTMVVNAKKVVAEKANLLEVKGHASSTTINGGTYYVDKVLVSPTAMPTAANEKNDVVGQAAANVVVNGGTYEVSGVAFNVDNGLVLTLNNGTVTKSIHAVKLTDGEVNVNNGVYNANDHAVAVVGTTNAAKLNIAGGTFKSGKASYALYLGSGNATYSVTGGIFDGGENLAAINVTLPVTVKNNVASVNKAVAGILKGGKYLNNIIAKAVVSGANYNISDQLVAEGYTVKEEAPYKVVVSTKASEETNKPGAKPGEEAPNTFDAGLVYMGLALSAIGASVVSVKKLRNN